MDVLTRALSKRGTEPVRPVLGTMNFGRRTPAPEATRIIHRALERGIFVIDTANAYENGESERILGAALRGRSEDVVVATKVGARRVDRGVEGLTAAVVQKSVEESRARLGRDTIDLLYLHVPDPLTPIVETLGAVQDLVQRGLVRAWGMSNYASWQMLDAMQKADAMGLPRPRIAQQLYNLLVRELEIEFLPFARRFDVHSTVYNPLAGGLLREQLVSSRFQKNRLYIERYFTDRLRKEAGSYGEIANHAELDLAALALRFLGSNPDVDSVLLGPATQSQLDSGLEALAQPPLDAEVLAACAEQHAAYLGTTTHYAR